MLTQKKIDDRHIYLMHETDKTVQNVRTSFINMT